MWEAAADPTDGIYHCPGGSVGGGGQAVASYRDAHRRGAGDGGGGGDAGIRWSGLLSMGGLSGFSCPVRSGERGPHSRHFDVVLGGTDGMDRDSSQPLSPEEAKARLRAAAQGLSLSKWMGRRTWRVLAVALAGGFIVGRVRVSALTQTMVMQPTGGCVKEVILLF